MRVVWLASLQPQHTQHKSLRPAPQLQGLIGRKGVGGGFHAGFTFKPLGGLTSRSELPGTRCVGFHKQQKRSEENTGRGMEWEVFLIIEEENVKKSFVLRKKATWKK
jgi:hypothetical protein